MKFETLMLHSLFAASLLICVLTMGSMLTSKAVVQNVAVHPTHVVAAVKTAG